MKISDMQKANKIHENLMGVERFQKIVDDDYESEVTYITYGSGSAPTSYGCFVSSKRLRELILQEAQQLLGELNRLGVEVE